MKELICLSIYIGIEFFTFLLCYVVLFDAKLVNKILDWIVTIILLYALHVTILCYVGYEGAEALSVLTMIVVPTLLVRPVRKKYLILYPFICMSVSAMNIAASFLISTFLKISEYKMISETIYIFPCQCLSVIILLSFYFYKKCKKIHEDSIEPDWKQYLIFYLSAISLFFILASLQVLSKGKLSTKYINYMGCACSLACVILVCVSLWQGIVVNRENKIRSQNQMYERYMELQNDYYKRLIEQDDKMRCFRHDMNGHFTAMMSYCNEKEISKLKDYLENMILESSIYSTRRYTGHNGVDAILSQYIDKSNKSEIDFSVKGTFSNEMRITDFDLCAIVDNLLKNAFEACMNDLEEVNKHIYVHVGTYNEKIYICIKNSVSKEIEFINKRPISTKGDFVNHGLGSKIVCSIVEKYEGTIEYTNNLEEFSVELFI